jgi:hypothetical protein
VASDWLGATASVSSSVKASRENNGVVHLKHQYPVNVRLDFILLFYCVVLGPFKRIILYCSLEFSRGR